MTAQYTETEQLALLAHLLQDIGGFTVCCVLEGQAIHSEQLITTLETCTGGWRICVHMRV